MSCLHRTSGWPYGTGPTGPVLTPPKPEVLHLRYDCIITDTDPAEPHEKTRSGAGLPQPVRPNATARVRTGGPCSSQGAWPVSGEARRASRVRPAVDQPGGERGVLAFAGPG